MEISGLGFKRVVDFRLGYPSGSEKWKLSPVGPMSILSYGRAQLLVGLIELLWAWKKHVGSGLNKASPSLIYYGPRTEPALTGSGPSPFQLYAISSIENVWNGGFFFREKVAERQLHCKKVWQKNKTWQQINKNSNFRLKRKKGRRDDADVLFFFLKKVSICFRELSNQWMGRL